MCEDSMSFFVHQHFGRHYCVLRGQQLADLNTFKQKREEIVCLRASITTDGDHSGRWLHDDSIRTC